MVKKDLDIVRTTTKTFEISFTKDGLAQDITGWTIYFTVKKDMKEIDDDAEIQKDVTSHSDAINGKTLIELSSTDTALDAGSYYYDIKYKDDDNNSGILFSGRIRFIQPVTRRE